MREIARDFARGLLCAKRRYGGCGACAVCDDVARLGAPRDMRVITPDEKDIISIETARDAAVFLSRTPGISSRKAVIIEDADRLTEEAQNMLLKTIEEPPEDSTLILLTPKPGALFETIRSRLVAVRFPFSSEAPASAKNEAARFDAALVADIAEKLCIAGELAEDSHVRERALAHWIRTFANALHGTEDRALRREIARNARIVLSGTLLLERSEVNPRLVVENMLLSFRPVTLGRGAGRAR